MIAGDHEAAAKAYRTAMTLQESAGFASDPPPFWYPIRRSLAAAMLAGGDPAGARRQLRASLGKWPEDPLALLLLAKAEQALGRPGPAARAHAQAKARYAADIDKVPIARI